jgi:phenylalanyl-tRNA synthetase beta chain
MPMASRPARVARVMSRALNAAGLFECVTWSFLDPDRLKRMGWDDPAGLITLQNPSSVERSVLRPSLVPGLLEVLAINANRQMADARLFEVGNVFAPHRPEDGDRPAHEELRLGVALTGLRAPRAWFTGGRERVDVYDAKGLAELALQAAGVTDADMVVWPADRVPAYLEPGRAARLVRGSLELGWFGEVALGRREVFDLPGPVFVAELSVSALAGLPAPSAKYEPLPRFPAVQRDLAIVVGSEVTAGEVEAAIRAMRLGLLARVTLFDVYTGGQVGPGRRSLAWSLTFQAPDRTLTDAEVNRLHERIVAEIASASGPRSAARDGGADGRRADRAARAAREVGAPRRGDDHAAAQGARQPAGQGRGPGGQAPARRSGAHRAHEPAPGTQGSAGPGGQHPQGTGPARYHISLSPRGEGQG